jgi:hypothetical protein
MPDRPLRLIGCLCVLYLPVFMAAVMLVNVLWLCCSWHWSNVLLVGYCAVGTIRAVKMANTVLAALQGRD